MRQHPKHIGIFIDDGDGVSNWIIIFARIEAYLRIFFPPLFLGLPLDFEPQPINFLLFFPEIYFLHDSRVGHTINAQVDLPSWMITPQQLVLPLLEQQFFLYKELAYSLSLLQLLDLFVVDLLGLFIYFLAHLPFSFLLLSDSLLLSFHMHLQFLIITISKLVESYIFILFAYLY